MRAMKTIGVLAATICAALLSVWIFGLFGTVTLSYEFIAGAVTAAVSLLVLMVASIIAEEISW